MDDSAGAAGVQTLFDQGLSLYRLGELRQSDSRLAELLERDPHHFDGLHLKGLIAAKFGRPGQAVALIQRAIRQNGNIASAHRHLGNALRDAGRSEEALQSYGKAIELRRDFKEAYVNRAALLLTLRRAAEALADLDRAQALGADDAQILTIRAAALIDLERPAEATRSCERAIARQPHYADAYVNRAAAGYLLGRYTEALADGDRAIALQRDHAAAHAQRGAALYALQRLDEALASLDEAIALQPASAFAHNLRALCLVDLQRPSQALESCERAIALRPDGADAHNTRGLALADLRQFDLAAGSFDRAIALQPDVSQPYFNKGVRYLQVGDFERGWDLYERRPPAAQFLTSASCAGPPWDGSRDIAGKTFFTYSEQGLGDTLQFSRYARLLEERGARVVLAVQRSLRALLRGLGPGIELMGLDELPPHHDFHCPLLSLPRAFGTRLESIPGLVPYLRADPVRVSRWRERLGSAGRLIGIRWQGSTGRADAGRSFPLRHFEKLASTPAVRLVSLQKGPGVEQLQSLPPHWRVEDLGKDFEPDGPDAFLDVAAVMQCVELVITSDTSIAHLAGALARPTWVAVKHVPDWRWMLDREESPWYPTLRLFRQPQPGDWDGLFERMRNEITKAP